LKNKLIFLIFIPIISIIYISLGMAFEQTHKEIRKGVFTFKNEPKGFREMQWGTQLEFFLRKHPKASKVDVTKSLKEKDYHEFKEAIRFYEEISHFRTIYKINGGDEKILGWPAKVFYGFLSNKLYSAFMTIEGKENIEGFESVIMARYGMPLKRETYYPKYMEQIKEKSVGVMMDWFGSITIIDWIKYTAIDQLYKEEKDYGFLKIESQEGMKMRIKEMEKVTEIFQDIMKKRTDKDF